MRLDCQDSHLLDPWIINPWSFIFNWKLYYYFNERFWHLILCLCGTRLKYNLLKFLEGKGLVRVKKKYSFFNFILIVSTEKKSGAFSWLITRMCIWTWSCETHVRKTSWCFFFLPHQFRHFLSLSFFLSLKKHIKRKRD